MNYIENVFICLAAPLLAAILCMSGRGRKLLLFFLGGMTACLLSSYISTFIAAAQGAGMSEASLEIAPLVEEMMKFVPILFYLLVFEPGREAYSGNIVLSVAIGFATLENVCYLIQNGAAVITRLLIRGFATGAVHVVCGAMIAFGLQIFWGRRWLRAAGTLGLLAVAATFHGVYNILVSQSGAVEMAGYLIPMGTIFMWILFVKKLVQRSEWSEP